MEKIERLISKLQQQYEAGDNAVSMLATLQMLHQEIGVQINDKQVEQRNITIVMPALVWNTNVETQPETFITEINRGADEEKMVFELEPFVQEEVAENVSQPNAATVVPPETHSPYLPEKKEIVLERIPEEKVIIDPVMNVQMAEAVPASIEVVEMKNPAIPVDKRSLNDLMEKPADELFTRLHEPIKDLKKAISINDRYQYITNLFSGDESVYDRSIKTINNFNIFSEAEYWIRRELAVKHGWRDNDPLVKGFYHLVSRRFS